MKRMTAQLAGEYDPVDEAAGVIRIFDILWIG